MSIVLQIPWSLASEVPYGRALDFMGSRVDEGDPQAIRAYVALRTLYTKHRRGPSEWDVKVEITPEAGLALLDEITYLLASGPSTPLDVLAHYVACALATEEDRRPTPKPPNPVVTVRRDRHYNFHR